MIADTRGAIVWAIRLESVGHRSGFNACSDSVGSLSLYDANIRVHVAAHAETAENICLYLRGARFTFKCERALGEHIVAA